MSIGSQLSFKQLRLVVLGLIASLIVACGSAPNTAGDSAAGTSGEVTVDAPANPNSEGEVIIGLITKTEVNPFFVKMKEGAESKAKELGVTLLTGAGAKDGDNEGQVTALENMINAGAVGILITPNDTKAIVPSILKAREQGVLVIALDTPTVPEDAVDALFATNNFDAGLLIGQWAKAKMGDTKPVIAMLDLAPGISVGAQRHNGFIQGYGLATADQDSLDLVNPPEVVCAQDTHGDQTEGQAAMENCLSKNPDINVVYTINEPSAFGAYQALKAIGRENDVLIVSVDGGCRGVQGVIDGQIGATSQQYPLKMAELGVEALVKYIETNEKPSGYVDTGVTLITDQAQEGVESKDSKTGMELCWGS